jgi:D-glycero-alpha-D-manno-heptose-7-phosphate kinase
MIISRTPFRISFFGGGTDYPGWYQKHGGAVLAASIDKYCYLACRYLPPFFGHRFRVVYSKIELCQTLDEIKHPAVREVLRYLNIDRGIEIHHVGDLPARSGMGSSSAFTVGLLQAMHALKGEMTNKHQLAMEGIHVEQERIREMVGSQDQVLAAYGGLNHVIFHPNGEISVRPLTLAPERIQLFNAHLMLIYTGIERTASTIADSYVPRIDEKRRALRTVERLLDEALSILAGNGDLTGIGELLHESWMAKRSLSAQVSNARIDELYARARDAGAIGGKITGAGGGGFLLLFVPPDLQDNVRAALSDHIAVPFKFEYQGSQVVFFDPEQDYSAVERVRDSQALRAFEARPLTPSERPPSGG